MMVAAMRDAGVNILFLSGNSVCWVSPFRDSSSGVPNRILTRDAPYGGLARQTHFDELKHFIGHTTGPDEGLLMGAINVIPVNGGGDWVCGKPEHWIFEGTGMKKGEFIPGMVGWPWILRAIIGFVLSDMLFYWSHVARHRIPLLWRFHSIHHELQTTG